MAQGLGKPCISLPDQQHIQEAEVRVYLYLECPMTSTKQEKANQSLAMAAVERAWLPAWAHHRGIWRRVEGGGGCGRRQVLCPTANPVESRRPPPPKGISFNLL